MTNEEHKKAEAETERSIMSPHDFARLGDGHIAYIRQLDVGEAVRMFPAAKGIPEGIDLYALISADGTPLSLRDNHISAIADAREHDLETVSLH